MKKTNFQRGKALRKKQQDPLILLSKKLSSTLRHNAINMGIEIDKEGKVSIDSLLVHNIFQNYTINDIFKAVEENDKKRFEIIPEKDILYIRAVQGHSIDTVEEENLLSEISNPNEIPLCIHGTYKKNLDAILSLGLSKMKRNHIHMAMGFPDDPNIVSGIRKNCNVFILIDVNKCLKEGNMRFFRSSNNVILTKGLNDSGIIPKEYFKDIIFK